LFVNAFSPDAVVYRYPRSLLPHQATTHSVSTFLTATGIGSSVWNSVKVAAITIALSTVVGFPAGFAVANYRFRGKSAFRLTIVSTRAFPAVILAVPLAYAFVRVGLPDSLFAVALVHTALALPFTVLVSASVFSGIPLDLQEAAGVFGAGPLRTFTKIIAPLALPGLAATMLFTFVTSWNEVFVSSILTIDNKTLPARLFVLIGQSPPPLQFAGGVVMLAPSLIFMLFIRKYLFRLFGSTLK
jgi:multiple sugar transport system permease protein